MSIRLTDIRRCKVLFDKEFYTLINGTKIVISEKELKNSFLVYEDIIYELTNSREMLEKYNIK